MRAEESEAIGFARETFRETIAPAQENTTMPERDLLKRRGGRIDPLKSREGPFDADDRIDQAIAESFPASDPPSWNSGVDPAPRKTTKNKKKRGPA